jgi:SAM-dependent methyltransferase
MQTPAERHLIERVSEFLCRDAGSAGVRPILNIGAGRSTVIEGHLADRGCRFICDRIDIGECAVEFPNTGSAWQCPVEKMTPLETGRYAAAFANYVLEHVSDLKAAASEIFRVLEPGGIFVTSVPNLTAPEFLIARNAPAGFQKLMTQGKGYETSYAWRTIGDLTRVLEEAGFIVEDTAYWSFTEGYLWRYPVINLLSRLYDRMISNSGFRHMMGNVCITLKKPRSG